MAISYTVSYTFSPSTTIWNGIEAKTKTFSNLGVDTELKSAGVVSCANGTVAAPSLTFTNSTGSGLYRVSADDIAFATAGTIALEVTNAQIVKAYNNITFSPTTKGLTGTTTNDAVSTGTVGEVVSAVTVRSSPSSLSSNTVNSFNSISLTAGDWEVRVLGAIMATNAGTSFTFASIGISKTNGAEPGADTICVPTSGEMKMANAMPASVIGNNNSLSYSTGPVLVTLASTTTLYAFAVATFSVSSAVCYGSIFARRIR
jgi:hypothetical protein